MHMQGFLGAASSAASRRARALLGQIGGLAFCLLLTISWAPQRLPQSTAPESTDQDGEAAQDGAAFEVSPGSVADALALIRRETKAATIPGTPWPLWNLNQGGWSAAEPWQRWAELIRAEAVGPVPDPLRRAQLALCARAQGRDQDAWTHLELVGANPELLAALLPSFLPGVGPSQASTPGMTGSVFPGGIAGELHSGDLLRLPEPPPLAYEIALERDIYAPYWKVRNLPVDASRVSISLMLTSDGIEVDLVLVSGPAVELRVQLPFPERQKYQSLYANWKRLEDPSRPIALQLTPEEPEGEVWGLLIPRTSRWPHRLPEGIDQRLAQGAVRLLGAKDDPFMTSAARGLGILLDIPIEVDPPRTVAGGIREPLSIALDAGEDRGDKLLNLLSLAEAYGLRQRPTESLPSNPTRVPKEPNTKDTNPADSGDSGDRDDS